MTDKKSHLRAVALASAVFVGTLGHLTATAQDVEDLETPNSPLVLKSQGSFVIGGQVIEAEPGDLGQGAASGHITVNQMYVEYMVPRGRTKVPVVMIHGGGLSGKSYETTPDGRMGWDEYFVRQGFPVYNVDQVSRARSGFDQTIINRVRDGRLPPSELFNISRTSDEGAWVNFRVGPEPGVPFDDTQFPVDHADDFSKQGIPTLNASLTPSTTTSLSSPDSYEILSELAQDLGGAILMGHSQSSDFPLRAYLNDPNGIKGAVFVETGVPSRCLQFNQDEVEQLATVPIVFIYGDHLDARPDSSLAAFNNCNALVDEINAAGGDATMIYPPDLGIYGNTHMMMIDKNNLEIADLLIEWIKEHVDGGRGNGHGHGHGHGHGRGR